MLKKVLFLIIISPVFVNEVFGCEERMLLGSQKLGIAKEYNQEDQVLKLY